jgi:hypothetical protein
MTNKYNIIETAEHVTHFSMNQHIEFLLRNIEDLCKQIRLEETGSSLQHQLCCELGDAANLLANPSDLEMTQNTTSNVFICDNMRPLKSDIPYYARSKSPTSYPEGRTGHK